MSPARTYWHLADRRRVPSSYELTSERLLYHPERGFALPTPVTRWYEQYQAGSRLRGRFHGFADPRATTYARYVQLQSEREAFLDEIARSIDDTAYDAGLDEGWLAELDSILPVLRYPVHALHMLSAYVGQMAPESRVVIACAFQAADELRRIQRLAFRLHQLRDTVPHFGDGARAAWQSGPAWQPWRELLEQLLTTYDFGEALIVLNLVVKPAFDRSFMLTLAEQANQRGDRLLMEMLRSLDCDCSWQRQWTAAFVRVALEEEPDNLAPVSDWIEAWWPRTRAAVAAGLNAFVWAQPLAVEAARAIETACHADWSALGIAGY